MRLTSILTVIICVAGGLAGCENAKTNSVTNTAAANANRNENANATATTSPSPAPERGQYTEEQAREERAKAKQNKETIGDSLDDAWIHAEIVAKLSADTKTPERNIDVDVVKNVVTLRGTVDTLEVKAETERVAKDTDGVTKVVNQLNLLPYGVSGNLIFGGDLDNTAVSKPNPSYPPIAKPAHAAGAVKVEIIVDESGKVIGAHPVSGDPLLQAAAVAAARQAIFSPHSSQGQAYKVRGFLTYEFQPQ